MASLISNLVTMIQTFTNIAVHDPLSAIVLATGTVLFVIAFGVFAYLVLGSLFDLVTPEVSGGRGQ